MQTPVASVIFTTYNQPAWLEKVLVGFGRQDRSDFEVLVADDGSRDETRQLVERLAATLPVTVRHLWQPDDGFRKCEALNMAIREARSDYLIFTDGDCIPRADFVSTHLALREPGRFLSGGYHKLPMDTSQAITADDIASGRAFDAGWLRSRGMAASRRDLKLTARGRWAWLLDQLSPARASWNGHNASCWTRDAIAITDLAGRVLSGLVILFLLFDAGLKLAAPEVAIKYSPPGLGWPLDVGTMYMLGILLLIPILIFNRVQQRELEGRLV